MVCCALLNCVQLFATTWTVANQAPLSMGILQARILAWTVMPSQGNFPTQGLNPGLLHCRWILYHLRHQESPKILEWVANRFSRGSWVMLICQNLYLPTYHTILGNYHLQISWKREKLKIYTLVTSQGRVLQERDKFIVPIGSQLWVSEQVADSNDIIPNSIYSKCHLSRLWGLLYLKH